MLSVASTAAKTVRVPLFIGGRLEASASDRCGEVFNPSTGRVQAEVPYCTAAEIDRAVNEYWSIELSTVWKGAAIRSMKIVVRTIGSR